MGYLPFEDPRAKVENAKEHIARVEAGFNEYVASSPKVTMGGLPGLQTVRFGPTGPVPKRIEMAAGDAIHNLRSALDILAGDVVQASGRSRKGVLFPFAGDPGGLEGQIIQKNFDRAAPEAVELLRSLKPYKGGNLALRALHDLDLADKHNFIIPSTNRNTVTNLRIGNIVARNCIFGDNGLGDIASASGMPMHVGAVETKLVFAPGLPANGEVIPLLHDLAELTAGIIEAFATLFSGGRDPTVGAPVA